MAQTTDIIHLNIILIGSTRHGKSSTGNSILGRKAFKTSSHFNSETKVVTVARERLGLYEIQVVDGPGLEDTDLDATKNNEQMFENMTKALRMCEQGIRVFVLVIKFGSRYTEEDTQGIYDLKQIFGENYLKDHGIIVITGGDYFYGQMEADGTPGKTFTEWCREQDDDFGNLIEECSYRVVLFNNISTSEDDKTRQRNELLFHAGRQQECRSTPICRMTQTTDRIPLNIILIGKTGNGKSATGNSILGRKAFTTASNTKSETKVVADAWTEHGLYDIQVVDGPGLEDTDLDAIKNNITACENMAKALMMCNGRIHAFVLVIRFGFRYTNEEKKGISDLKQIFGKNYLQNHGIIVIAGGDVFSGQMAADGTPGKTFNAWYRGQGGDFGNLIAECSSRVVLFNNLSTSEEEQTRQRNELLLHAGTLQKEKGSYTTENFQKYAQVRDKLIKDSNQNILKETIQKRIDLLSVELGRLSIDSSLEDVDKLDTRITDVYTEIGKENLHEESMQQLIGSLKRLRTTTEELRKVIQEKDMHAVKLKIAVMPQYQEELNKVREVPWGRIAAGIGLTIFAVATIGTGIGALAVGVAALGTGVAAGVGVAVAADVAVGAGVAAASGLSAGAITGLISGGVAAVSTGVVAGTAAGVVASGGALIPAALSLGKVVLRAAATYLDKKLQRQ